MDKLNDGKQQKEYASSMIYLQMRSQPGYGDYTVGEDSAFRLWSEACVQTLLGIGGTFEVRYDSLRHAAKATFRCARMTMGNEALAGLSPLAMLSCRTEFFFEDGECCFSAFFLF